MEQRQAEVDQLRAQLAGAPRDLDKTTVLVPTDAYVTSLALRKGARVSGQTPVMAFIDTSDTIVGTEIQQIYSRYPAPDKPVEVTSKAFPGEVYSGRVATIIQAIATCRLASWRSRRCT